MSNSIVQVFQDKEIRIIEKEDGFWWVASDVCSALDVGNVSQALNRLDDDERSTIILNDGTAGNPLTSIVSESGLYSLVLTSRKPSAKTFKKWVTSEVLPTIRRTGVYLLAEQEDPNKQPLALKPAIERVESLRLSLEYFGIDRTNPRFEQCLKDLVGDALGLGQKQITGSTDLWCGVAERAEKLGYPVATVTRFRSQLGKAVKAQIAEDDRKEEDRLCNGTMRSVKLYRVTEDLDAAIHGYLGGKA